MQKLHILADEQLRALPVLRGGVDGMKKKTYKDLIIKSMEKVDGTEKTYPVTLSDMYISLSAVVTLLTLQILERTSTLEPEELALSDALNVMMGRDWVRATMLTFQIDEFVSWLLKETTDEFDDDGAVCWSDYEHIAAKFNEFVKIKKEGVDDDKP